MKLALALIREDGGTQSRAVLVQETISAYAELLRSGVALPPVIVFYDGQDHWLADGFHRVSAAEEAQLTEIDAEVRQGTQRDAIFYSFGANATHGLQRSSADKRRTVERMLADSEWGCWSDRKIADSCCVSHTFVAAVRRPASDNAATSASGFRSHGGNVATPSRAAVDHDPESRPPTLPGFSLTPPPPADPHAIANRLAVEAETALKGARALVDAAWAHPRARLLLTAALEDTARWCSRRQRDNAA